MFRNCYSFDPRVLPGDASTALPPRSTGGARGVSAPVPGGSAGARAGGRPGGAGRRRGRRLPPPRAGARGRRLPRGRQPALAPWSPGSAPSCDSSARGVLPGSQRGRGLAPLARRHRDVTVTSRRHHVPPLPLRPLRDFTAARGARRATGGGGGGGPPLGGGPPVLLRACWALDRVGGGARGRVLELTSPAS